MLKNDARFWSYPGVKRILKAIPDQITDEQIDRYIEQWGKKKKTKKSLK